MKKIFLSTIACLLLVTASFANPTSRAAFKKGTFKAKKTWTKNVWSIIDLNQKINESLFLPLNDKMAGFDAPNEVIDLKLFEKEKASIQWNLWTILFYNVVKGDLTLYSPFNPDWENDKDNGFFKYPITTKNCGTSEDGNFFTDSLFRMYIKDYGFLGFEIFDNYAQPLQSWEYPDEDSLTLEGYTVYPPNDFVWHQDKDIIKYKIREEWLINKNGEVLDKSITSIAPVVLTRDQNGNITGEKELFWVDFSELKDILKPYYFLLARYRKERVISFYEFFNQREFYASVDKEDKIQIKVE